MASTFFAFIRRDRLPTAAQVSRALSSRGDRVALRTEAGLDQVGGTLGLEVNGGEIGLEDRQAYLDRCRRVLGVA